MSQNPSSALPTGEQMHQIESLSVLDASGNQVQCTSLMQSAQMKGVPLVLIFTRHFHCGMCKQFVRALARSSVLTDASKAEVIVVGPGEAHAIEYYKKDVGSPPFQFLADPQTKLYHALGMTIRTYESGDEKTGIPSHHSGSLLGNAFSSVADMVKSGTLAFKGGDFKQLGGDFVWDKRGKPVLAHRMQHTRDHTEVSQLEDALSQSSIL